jgi:hypothetical protein
VALRRVHVPATNRAGQKKYLVITATASSSVLLTATVLREPLFHCIFLAPAKAFFLKKKRLTRRPARHTPVASVGAAPCRSSAFPVVVEVDAINVLYVAFASPNSKHPRLLSLGDIYGLPSVSSPLLTLFLSLCTRSNVGS